MGCDAVLAPPTIPRPRLGIRERKPRVKMLPFSGTFLKPPSRSTVQIPELINVAVRNDLRSAQPNFERLPSSHAINLELFFPSFQVEQTLNSEWKPLVFARYVNTKLRNSGDFFYDSLR